MVCNCAASLQDLATLIHCPHTAGCASLMASDGVRRRMSSAVALLRSSPDRPIFDSAGLPLPDLVSGPAIPYFNGDCNHWCLLLYRTWQHELRGEVLNVQHILADDAL